ncbi:MAG: nuclear transport factor 2 family protein [Streptomyces sp.]|uniref:nuclear transport factor 2 family protein n=1 Tax=Streptomyces sp. TaxID=1931 RepID=UPI0025F97DB8|nr:nuclear transport factor 2 family protein [Streptomyces sp.]MBW8793602.1 nuclear transport factor 2 family protein [Streptomyces sp.]
MDDERAQVAAAIAGELRLMDPAVRASRELAAELLDPEFVEVGASGRRFTYEQLLAELPDKPGASADGPRYEPSGLTGVVLAPGLVQVTFEARLGDRRSRHSSLWRRHDEQGAWRMYYHHATAVPPGVA